MFQKLEIAISPLISARFQFLQLYRKPGLALLKTYQTILLNFQRTGFECENKFFSATNLLKFDDFVVFQQICITPPVYRQTEFSIFGENPTPPCPFPPFPFCNVFSWNLDCIRQEMEKGDWVSPHSYQVFLTIFLGYFVLFSGDTNNKNKLPFLICDNRCQWRGGGIYENISQWQQNITMYQYYQIFVTNIYIFYGKSVQNYS